jgi:ketosteroid isomerase-like protein
MVTTTMLRMPAHPWDFTGRDTFTTAYFWAWDRGPAGVTGTDGAAIASSTVAEDAITAAAVMRRITDAMAEDLEHAAITTADIAARTMAHRHAVAQSVMLPTPQHNVVAAQPITQHHVAVAARAKVVVERAVVVERTVVVVDGLANR